MRGSCGADLAVPAAALVFDLGVDAGTVVDLGADGEGAAWLAAGGMRDGVGGEFPVGQQDGGVRCGVAARKARSAARICLASSVRPG